jgi:O-methyltransferase involved in polyketide biosynthesis
MAAMRSPGPLSGVGRTALAVARVRAQESRRPDRLFDDWLARHGWRVEIHELATVASSYGRPSPGQAHSGFVAATYHAGHHS